MHRRSFFGTSLAALTAMPVGATQVGATQVGATQVGATQVGAESAVSARESSILQRPIPSSGELLPVIGLGTWQTFDVGTDAAARAALRPVLQALHAAGGRVVDSSPMYGSSESVVGDLAAGLGLEQDLFMATKVWTSGEQEGISQMRRSMQRMRSPVMDLMQVHNLLDAHTHLRTLEQWKQQGSIRYLGITHYHAGGYAEMMQLMRDYALDFIQINYSMLSREVEQQLLPLAVERDIAVLINRPYEGGQLFRRVRGEAVPEWARDFDCSSWGQFFLKYLLANPAVTCVIPGTSKLAHLQDNLAAGRGELPNASQRARMLAWLDS